MVIYHIMYNLKFLYGVDVPIFFENWFNLVRDTFVGIFVLISGIVTAYSKSNIKRGVKCFFLGMGVTFVTAFAPIAPILFGILHMLGVCMMLFGLFEGLLAKIKPPVGIAVCIFLFVLTFNVRFGYLGFVHLLYWDLPTVLYSVELLFPLGFAHRGFSSGDYFPLLPWVFLFTAGGFCGRILRSSSNTWFIKSYCKPIGFVGRHSIWVYLLHQPIAFLILTIIFN
ncbi:MAG: DUF1624 domain-containing protein [Oscillospiraceae bacterium]|nr:DUF1624 domain-containing protein [Oscillospiraceae bacterium]